MARNRKRACLQHGPFLDLAWLLKNNLIQRVGFTPARPINWSFSNHGSVESGSISAGLDGTTGWLKICIGKLSQQITLIGQPRNFGGQQWYFICPVTARRVSVLWKPPRANLFASRYAWPGQVAYLSQFGNWIDRAHLGKERIKSRLRDVDPERRELPPRPRGMRLQTYNKLAKRFDDSEEAGRGSRCVSDEVVFSTISNRFRILNTFPRNCLEFSVGSNTARWFGFGCPTGPELDAELSTLGAVKRHHDAGTINLSYIAHSQRASPR